MNHRTALGAVLASTAFMIMPPAGLSALQEPVGSATITGTVLDDESCAPVSGAQVFVRGTTNGTLADSQGRFRLDDVPAGHHEIVVRLIGYLERADSVRVGAGDVAEMSFEVVQTKLRLQPMVCMGCTWVDRFLRVRAVRAKYLSAAQGTISVGETLDGFLSAADSVDGTNALVWRLEGKRGDTVTVWLSSEDFWTELHVFGPGGSAGLDGGMGSWPDDGAWLTFEFAENGTHGIVVSSFRADVWGDPVEGKFELRVFRGSPPPPLPPELNAWTCPSPDGGGSPADRVFVGGGEVGEGVGDYSGSRWTVSGEKAGRHIEMYSAPSGPGVL